jgi:hypothetical protein
MENKVKNDNGNEYHHFENTVTTSSGAFFVFFSFHVWFVTRALLNKRARRLFETMKKTML